MNLLWELTRSTALVATASLSATVALGVLAASPTGRVPRFVTQGLHRHLAAVTVSFVVAHVVTVLADAHVPLSWADGAVPFRAAYQPVGTALGTLAVDVLAAVVLTSLLRGRLGHRAWRAVHLLSWALWPLALLHGLLIGTDDQAVRWTCLAGTAPVAAALAWRVAPRRVAA
jgi:sulfoxide reductase heme-binding subunit YedZ